MKASILLADAASYHPDGTISILRAWINRIHGKEPPYRFSCVLVARVQAAPGEAGEHEFRIACEEVGSSVVHEVLGRFEIDPESLVANFILQVRIEFGRPGAYAFVLELDGKEADRLPLEVGAPLPTEVKP